MMSDIPERIAFRKKYMTEAITNGPLMQHPDFVQYVRADRIEELEAKLAKVIAAYRIETMRRDDYSHAAFDQHITELKGQDDGS
jgi:hypothetical protein